MAVLYPFFLNTILRVHELLQQDVVYPFFDPACRLYETLRAVRQEGSAVLPALDRFAITEHGYRTGLRAFEKSGVAGLVGLDARQLVEDFPVEVERKAFVLRSARPSMPATKMVMILKGFGIEVSVTQMRHLYASYGWAQGTKPYGKVDFVALNRRAKRLDELQNTSLDRVSFFAEKDRLQTLLEVFRTLTVRGVSNRFPGSRAVFDRYKNDFLSLGLMGLVERAPPSFRNSKLGFKEEGWVVLSKIQHPERNEAYYRQRLAYKKIIVDKTCITKIFSRWNVMAFQSPFRGELERLARPEDEADAPPVSRQDGQGRPMTLAPLDLDQGFIACIKKLDHQPVPLANPGIFLFLPYLDRLQLLEKVSNLLDVDPEQGYSWFSLLLLNLGRILGGISSVSRSCRTSEQSFPFFAGLAEMPCADSLLNGLATIGEAPLLELRRYLTKAALQQGLVTGKRIAFDFHMRDFTHNDVELKNIGKGPSPTRQICFPGFRPHLAWDVETGAPITLEFRNGRARASTTFRRFFQELLHDSLGRQTVEHVYLDSEYTADKLWQFLVDPNEGLGAHLTLCIRKNPRVKKYIDSFLKTTPTWLFYDDDHTFSEQTFGLPIGDTGKKLQCVLKRHETKDQLRCFGSTLPNLGAKGILDEYTHRWTIENGIKDLIGNYYFDQIPGIDPHRINLHYFIVTLARLLFEMLARDYEHARNADGTQKSIGTLRSEFLTGVNASLSRSGNRLRLTWLDPYSEKRHQVLKELFAKLTHEADAGLPFLGGLQLAFDITAPRSEDRRNQRSRHKFIF